MTLHTTGPADMAEDEQRIGKGYQKYLGSIYASVPVGIASFVDTKWVVAVGFALLIVMLHEVGGRLHDLCIRQRRTNILLAKQISN